MCTFKKKSYVPINEWPYLPQLTLPSVPIFTKPPKYLQTVGTKNLLEIF